MIIINVYNKNIRNSKDTAFVQPCAVSKRIRMTSDRQQCFSSLLITCVLSLSCVDVCECCYSTFSSFSCAFLMLFLFIIIFFCSSWYRRLTHCCVYHQQPILFNLPWSLSLFLSLPSSFPFLIYTTLCEKRRNFYV